MALAQLTQPMMDSLSEHIALLDERGEVVAVNGAWCRYACDNGGYEDGYLHTNYLTVCRRASDAGDETAQTFLAGIGAVLRKERSSFQLEYPCHSPTEQRWFSVLVTPLEAGAVVAHLETTHEHLPEYRLRAVFDSLDAALYVLDRDAKVRFFNRAASYLSTQFQRDVAEIGTPFSQLVPAPFRPEFYKSFRTALRGTPVYHERQAFGRWFEVGYQPVFTGGSVGEVCLSFRDVTARRAAQREDRVRQAALYAEQTPVAVLEWDTSGLITAWNPAAERIFGYSAAERIGREVSDLFAASTKSEDAADALDLSRVSGTHTHTTKAGETVVCRWLSAPLWDEQGAEARMGMVAFAQDVSAEQHLREALSASTEQFLRVFRRSLTPMLLVTRDLRITHVNASFLELTGYSYDELTAQTLSDLSLRPQLDLEVLLAQQPLNRSVSASTKQTLKTRGGLRYVTLSAEAVELDGSHLLLACTDATQVYPAEAQLLRAFQEVMRDADWFGRAVLEKLAQQRAAPSAPPDLSGLLSLTRRERQVLHLLAKGKDNEEIAGALRISHPTVRNYVTRIYDKLGVHSRAEAVVWARERGLSG